MNTQSLREIGAGSFLRDYSVLQSHGAVAFPVNGVQICGNGLTVAIATCIPYLKGCGQPNQDREPGANDSVRR